MKIKTNNILILVFLTIFLVGSFISAKADDTKTYDIEITSINTKYIETKKFANNDYEYYKISIDILNKGPSQTDNLSIILIDDEGIDVTKKQIIPSTEIKTITFEDYPLLGTKTHNIDLQILDSQNNTLKTQKLFFNKDGTVDPKNDASETPGFEIIVMMASIFTMLIILKRK